MVMLSAPEFWKLFPFTVTLHGELVHVAGVVEVVVSARQVTVGGVHTPFVAQVAVDVAAAPEWT